MISLQDLHDATLVSLEVDWFEGTLRCNFTVDVGGKNSVLLLAYGLLSLKFPRRFPWGRSASVNKMRVDKSEKTVLLVIEMQSGDVIEAQVERLDLE